MNVLLVIEGTYPWYRGGVSEWVYQYIRNCDTFNFTILQIATDTFISLEPGEALYPMPENIVSFERVPPPEHINDWDSSLTKWCESIFLEVELNSEYDIIHVTNTGFAGFLGAHISSKIQLPLVLTEHAIYWLEVEKGAVALECGYEIPSSEKKKNEIVLLFKTIAADVYLRSSEVITVSECNIPLQKKLGASRVNYIPNGISESWIDSEKISTKKPVLGWVGRCAEMKNPLQFFDLIDEFNKLNFECGFLMLLSDAGEKELELKVKARAANYDNIEIIWNESSEKYYAKMDMLLITSHNESQPLVMFEALSKKVLPVGRQVGDLTDKYGYTFSPDISNTELSENIIEFWKNKSVRKKYIDQRFKKVQLNHTWESIFKKYRELLTNSIGTYEAVL